MTVLAETFEAAGFVGPILVVCLVLMWFAIGERFFLLRGPRAGSVTELLTAATPTTPLGAAIVACRELAGEGRAPMARLRAAVGPYVEVLQEGATVVRSAAAVAPLAGLLGTVTGMIETFDSLGDMELFSRNGGIGAGISEAMISTQLGLVVAVPGILLGTLLDRKQAALEDQLDTVIRFLSEDGHR